MHIVGLKDDVTSAGKKLSLLLQAHDPKTHQHADMGRHDENTAARAEPLGKNIADVQRNHKTPRSEFSYDKTKIFKQRELEKSKISYGSHVHLTSSVQNIDQSPLYDIDNQEQLHKQKEDTSANVQISRLKDSGSKTKIFRQRELEKSKIASRSNTTQDKSYSSDSDAESHDIIFVMKASSLDGIKTYFQDSSYDKYYDDAKNEGSSFTFRLNSCDKKDVLFFNRLKQLKVEDFEFIHKDEKNLTSVVKELKSQINGLYVDIKDNKMHIVGLKDDVTSAGKKLSLLLQAYHPKTHQRADMGRHDENTAARAEPLGKNIADVQRNHKTPRSEFSYDKTKIFKQRELEKSKISYGSHVHLTSSVQNIDQSPLYDIDNQEQLHKQKEDTSANVQISRLKDSGSKTKIFRQRELEKSKIASRSNTTQDKSNSSDSDAESHDIIYVMKASSLDGIKTYFQDSSYDKYYDDVKNEGSSFTFRLNSCDKKDVLFFNRLKQLKVEDFEFGHKDEKNLTSVVKELKSQINGLYVDIKDNKMYIVGLKDDVTSAGKKLSLLLQAHDPKTHQHADMGRHDENTAARAEPLGKNIADVQRNHKTPRSEFSYDKTKIFKQRELEKSKISYGSHVHLTSSVQNIDQSPLYDIDNQEQLHKQKEDTSANVQISRLKDSGSKTKIFRQRELEKSKIASRSNTTQDKSYSSDSDAESHDIIFVMKASSLDGIKTYFQDSSYNKYYDDVKNEGSSFTFRLNSCDKKDVLFFNRLKQLKVEDFEFGHKDEKNLTSVVKELKSQISGLYVDIKDNKMHIVGLKDDVTSAGKKLSLLLQAHDPKTHQHADMGRHDENTAARAEPLGKNIADVQRNHKTPRSEFSDDKTKIFKQRELEKSKISYGSHVHLTSSVQNIDQSPLYDIDNQEQLHKQKEDTSANVQISRLKDSGSKTKIFRQRELEKSKIASRSNTTQDKSYSSDSDAESHDIIYVMKASSLDGIKTYFQDSSYDKYYDDVKNEGSSFTFRLNSCDKKDVLFFNRLKQLKVEDFEFGHKDEKNLTSVVKELKSQISGLYVDIKDNKMHIVGLKDDVTSAGKKLSLLLQAHDPKTHQRADMGRHDENTAARAEPLGKNIADVQRNHKTPRSEFSDDKTFNEIGRSQKSEHDETRLKEPQSHRLTHELHWQPSLLPEGCLPNLKASKTTYSEYSLHSIFTKDHNIYCVISERSKLKVKIFNANITKLQVDCVVNSANKRLQHGAGVAKAISVAAGPALKKECEDFTLSGNQVAVTDIFTSTGGQMPAKCVMHAVGPKWDNYDDQRKLQCFEDLRHTVLRCLVEAGRQGFTSIALPSMSAAISKVPREECARCYMEAVKHYDIFIEEQTSSLHDINFVDVDDSMIKIIKEHFQKNWAKPCDPYIVEKDCDFTKTQLHSASKNPAKNVHRSPDTSKLPSSSAAKTPGTSKSSFPAVGNKVASSSELRTERSSAYQIGKFTLRTDSRPAFNHSVDITITVGNPFDKLSGLRDFSVSSNKEEKQSLKNTFTLFNVFKPKSKQLVCALLPEPDNTDNIKEAFENMGKVIQSPNHKVFMQTTANVVITSSILYEEPDNKQKKGNKQVCDRKKVGNFAKCLFDYLDQASKKTAPKMSIIVVGSEDALQCIHKLMESRGVSKISPEVNPSSHQGASSMTSTRRQSSDYQETYSTKHSSNFSVDSHYANEGIGTSVDVESPCQICYEKNILFPVSCCNKNICTNCLMKMPVCPFCRKFWRILTGVQPPGTMSVSLINDHADGYEGLPAWEIKYRFPGSLQKEHHPNPGKWYDPVERRAYLPATDAGFQVLIHLRVAFLRKLIFTIGQSLTTDRENSIVWNDIHHKTSLHGGTYGYPDVTYLHRVTSELANKGVMFDTFTQSERDDIERLHENLLKFGNFHDS